MILTSTRNPADPPVRDKPRKDSSTGAAPIHKI
jgi:hypothetical protein